MSPRTLRTHEPGDIIPVRLNQGDMMDRDVFTETIRAFKHRTPFKPFTVATVNGSRYEVDHPDALALRDGVALFAGPGGVPVIFDHEGVSEVIGDLSGRGLEAS
jgi:hypothetical protein